MKTEKNNQTEFWSYVSNGNGYTLEVSIHKFLEFLEANGFGNFEIGTEKCLVRLENNIIKKSKGHKVNSFAKEYLRKMPEQLEHNLTRENLTRIFHEKLPKLVHKDQLHTLQSIEPNYKKDTANSAFKYYKNCFVEVCKDGIVCHDYKNLDGVIWDNQIIEREFKSADINEVFKESEFCRFLFNCMGKDENRYKSIISIIGYLIHTYKDPANAKAIFFCDERISENPEGGSGKSLTGNALMIYTQTAFEDGRRFSPTSAFSFQQMEHDTKLVWIDDAIKGLDFNAFFTLVTNGMTLEKKYQNKIYIPFEDSPKFLLTTNFVIEGIGGSFERRMVEAEFSPHYNVNNTPESEFGHRFFDENWGEKQWTLFDNFMLYSIQYFLCNGIVKPPKININIRKIIQMTNNDFVEFADTIERNKEHTKMSIFDEFASKYPDFQNMSKRTFTDWLKIYAEYTEDIYRMDERRSNLDRFFTFLQKPQRMSS